MLRAAVLSPFVSHDIGAFLAHMTQEDLTILGDLMQAGKVRSVIDRRYRLSEAPEAVRYVEEGHARGKVVITVDHEDEPAKVNGHFAASAMDTVGPVLLALASVIIAIGVPIAGALMLNRRFPRGPGKRSYKWGYYFSLQSLIAGIGLGVLLEAGAVAVIVCAAVYAGLAWFFVQRRHWAWITLTILSFNPVIWLINFIYLRRRWSEDALATPAV
jgi:hypothetical protein